MREERGVILVFVCIILGLLLSGAALLIDLGRLANAKRQVKAAADHAAMGAIETYLATSGSYAAKLSAARDRAQELIASNPVVGLESGYLTGTIGAATNGTGGQLDFGTWYAEQPQGSDPCSSDYPCFRVNATPGPANAARLSLRSTTSDVLQSLFGAVTGEMPFNVEVTTINTAIPRCMVFLVDMSSSMTDETHNTRLYTSPPYSMFAFSQADVDKLINLAVFLSFNPGVTPDSTSCNPSVNGAIINDLSSYILCWMWFERPSRNAAVLGGYSPTPQDHYIDDYQAFAVNGVTYYIDIYRDPNYQGPEPLSTLLKSVNLVISALKDRGTSADRAAIRFYDHLTEEAWRGTPLANVGAGTTLELLQQVTNMWNAPTQKGDASGLRISGAQSNPIAPNYISVGAFPLSQNSYSHLWGALEVAVDMINASCPVESERYIVSMGDGLQNCIHENRWADYRLDCPTASYPISCARVVATDSRGDIICGDNEDTYTWIADVMEEWGGRTSGGSCLQSSKDCIVEEMIDSKIRFIQVLVGDAVAPQFKDRISNQWQIWNSNPVGPEPPKYYTLKQLYDLQLNTYDRIGGWPAISRCSPAEGNCSYTGCCERWHKRGTEGYTYPLPNRQLDYYAERTGGTMCPIMQVPNTDPSNGTVECEPDTNNPFNLGGMRYNYSLRNPNYGTGQALFKDPYCRSKGFQAFTCLAEGVLNTNPFRPVGRRDENWGN